MLCINPFIKSLKEKQIYGCGQCFHCRINRRREWEARMLLEQLSHEHTCFVTLTYDNLHLPLHTSGRPCRDFSAHSNFLKRLREKLSKSERRLRYFGCFEMGKNGDNPHFHFILFGVSFMEKRLIESCWKNGFVMLGDVNKNSIRYCAKYVLKSTDSKDARDFHETSFKSQGLGKQSITHVINAAIQWNDCEPLTTMRFEGQLYPLGRYLLTLQRRVLGITLDEENNEEKTMHQLQKEAQIQTQLEKINSNIHDIKKLKLKGLLLKESAQHRLNRETKFKIFAQEVKL